MIDPEIAAQLEDEIIAEYPEVLPDKLPQGNPEPVLPDTRYGFKDEKKTVNGQMFALPEKFLSSMIEFLEEHLTAGQIKP